MKVNVFNLIILDESGSMESIKKPSLDGLNETLQSIRGAQEKHQELQRHYVTLVVFHSHAVRTVFDKAPVAGIRMLNDRDYRPDGCTPLYDAMGNSLSKLRHQLDAEEKNQVLVTIITDGQENASTEYTGKMIKRLVEELKEAGWVFTYIGANQDVEAVAGSLSIDNAMPFEATEKGVGKMYARMKPCMDNFYCQISDKLFDDDIDLSKGFFGDSGKDKDIPAGKGKKLKVES